MEVTGWGRTMLCELCQCEEADNFRHFIPRTLYSNKWFKRRYTRQEMQQGMEAPDHKSRKYRHEKDRPSVHRPGGNGV